MLKLARNSLSDLGVFCDDNGDKICWSFISGLFDLQKNWRKQKMKVKLAAQTFSRSVSDALQFLSDSNMKGFTQCLATIEFIRQACELLIANAVYITLFCSFVLYHLYYTLGVKCSVLSFLFILCFSYSSPLC